VPYSPLQNGRDRYVVTTRPRPSGTITRPHRDARGGSAPGPHHA
jgi:hypothetical protein